MTYIGKSLQILRTCPARSFTNTHRHYQNREMRALSHTHVCFMEIFGTTKGSSIWNNQRKFKVKTGHLGAEHSRKHWNGILETRVCPNIQLVCFARRVGGDLHISNISSWSWPPSGECSNTVDSAHGTSYTCNVQTRILNHLISEDYSCFSLFGHNINSST